MRTEHILTKISLGIDIVAIIVLLVYFIAIAPNPPVTGLGGLFIISPPIFGVFGITTALLGRKKSKTRLSIACIILNVIFLCWLPIVWYGGTLILGT